MSNENNEPLLDSEIQELGESLNEIMKESKDFDTENIQVAMTDNDLNDKDIEVLGAQLSKIMKEPDPTKEDVDKIWNKDIK